MADPRILVVEDNPSDLALTLHALKADGVPKQVDVVRDGAEALEYLFGAGRYEGRRVVEGPDLVLLDLKLPLVDGFEVLRAVRSATSTESVPITILTSSAEERDITQSYRLGANSYVVKPTDFRQFAKALHLLSAYWLQLNKPAPRRLG